MFKFAVFLLLLCTFDVQAELSKEDFESLRLQIRDQYTVDPKIAIQLTEQALNTSRLSADQEIKILNYKGWFQMELNQLSEAMRTTNEIKRLISGAQDKSLIYAYYNLSGGIYSELGLYELALVQYKDALVIAEQRGEAMVYQTKSNIADVYFLLGQYDVALDYYTEYLQFLNSNNDKLSQSLLYNNIAKVYIAKNEYDKALQFIDKAQQIQKSSKSDYHLAYSSHYRGKIALARGQLSAASAYFKKAITTLQRLGSTRDVNDVKLDLIALDIKQGDIAKAKLLAEEVLDSTKQTNTKNKQASALSVLAKIAELQGNSKQALVLTQELSRVEREIYAQQRNITLSRASYELEMVEKELEIESLKRVQAVQAAEASAQQKWLLSIIVFMLIYAISTILVIQIIRRRNGKLRATLEELTNTQEMLVEAEKMSSLAGLVSGMAHHLNTPIGLVITANSSLNGSLRDVQDKFEQKTLLPSQLNHFIGDALVASDIVDRSANRLNAAVERFKAINTSIGSAELKTIEVSDFLNLHIREMLIRTAPNAKLMLNNDSLEVQTYPNILLEVLKEFMHNSVQHGFINNHVEDQPLITIRVNEYDDTWQLSYKDNGRGLPDHNTEQVFNPFFSTNLASQLGLGLTIVFNSVSHVLQGSIKAYSDDKGVEFLLTLPKQLKSGRRKAVKR
ncbi:ATP-binding protein [Pseudoalteromonas sp. GCY]|uniref:tetratricopeptide repeat-containing sensor histidine kinase n=1 Tax=Pseudoalteromonas sp. GCY TaxID=2003316 RepID=UPI000BFEF13D|nr:tetratricopeptide repeat protein [Pseudoalteromonas sp. GCY]PHI38208.1 ATP-binding protein [Pseudoalteromonas sp. GCY]QQQ66265.1 tetratricopeptide repeat protein [Pseudoalteromonas sp. GCY]